MNIESSTPKLVTTRDEVAAWCTDRFSYLLSQHGISPVKSGETVQLSGEVVQFYVTEDTRYKGSVGIKLKIERPEGVKVWQGMTYGSAKRFGGSYKDENYYEVASDSFIEAFRSFTKDNSICSSLEK